MKRTHLSGVLAGWLMIMAALIMVHAAPAHAIATDEFPDADTALGGNTNNVRASVALGGPGFSRNTPIGDFKIFYPLSGPGALPPGITPLSLRIENACRPPDAFTPNTDMDLSIHLVQADGSLNPANLSLKSANTADCVGNDIFLDFTSADLRVVPSMYGTDWGVIMLRAQKTNAPGATDFRVRVQNGNGRVTYAEQTYADALSPVQPSQSAFAIFDSITRDDPRDYSFDFKPDCSFISTFPGSDPYIKWQDADANTYYENNNIWFTIERRDGITDNIEWTVTINNTTVPDIGNDGDFRSLQIQMGDTTDYFRWSWFDVTGFNGVEFWIPFSEMNRTVTSCPPPAGALTCSVIVPATINPSTDYNVQFSITNNTGGLIDAGDGYDMGANFGGGTPNYMAPNGGDWVRADIPWATQGPIPDGGTMTWTETFRAARPSVGVGLHTAAGPYSGTGLTLGNHNFTFGMISGGTYTGAICPATLTVVPLPGSITCTITINPVTPSINQDITIRVSINNNPASGFSLTNADNPLRVSATKGILGSTVVAYAPDPLDPGPVPAVGTITANAGALGAFTVTATIQMTAGPPVSCPSQAAQVAAKPYVKFFGGDVYAGGWFNDGANACAVQGGDATATIKTFARNDRFANAYNGSSVEFAAFTMAGITGDSDASSIDQERGFYSASTRSRGREGLYLTFANTDSGYAAPNDRWHATFWGGGFDTNPKCIEDFFTTTRLPSINAAPGSFNINTIGADGQYEFSDGPGIDTNVIQSPGPQLFARRATIYSAGDVYIDDNISYDTNFAAGIPYLTIIAKGNIYIDASVTNIDALLIAQPTDTTGAEGGRIYTCAQRAGFSFSLYDQASIYAACSNKLTIHGAMIAQQVRFFRTNGTLGQAGTPEFPNTATIAEVIDTTPEFFMGTPMFRPRAGSSTGAQMYHAIQALPPVF